MATPSGGFRGDLLGGPGAVEEAGDERPLAVDTFGGRVPVDGDPEAAGAPLDDLQNKLVFHGMDRRVRELGLKRLAPTRDLVRNTPLTR